MTLLQTKKRANVCPVDVSDQKMSENEFHLDMSVHNHALHAFGIATVVYGGLTYMGFNNKLSLSLLAGGGSFIYMKNHGHNLP